MRRAQVGWITLGWALLSASASLPGEAERPSDARPGLAGSRPNIVLFLADDLSYYDLSHLGQRHFETPHIDRLARQGIVFTNAYAGAPECAPSRGSLLTGMHLGHCRIRANRSARGQDHLLPEDVTIAEVLQRAGYATAFIGKWGVGLPGTPGAPDRQGFDFSYGYYDQLRAHGFFPDYVMENGREVPIPENHGFDMDRLYEYNRRDVDHLEGVENRYDDRGRLIPGGVADPARARYSEHLFREAARRFLRETRDTPFFLYYATQLPHGPLIAPDLGAYREKPWDLKHREWAAMVHTLDESLGTIVEELERQGLFGNTIFLFASDNGYSQWGYFARPAWQDDPLFENKGPWHKGKFICTDGGVRVPFFASWPGRIAPGTSDHLTALFDVLATAAELAGVDLEQPTDGISLVPLLEGRAGKQRRHRYLYWENGSMSRHAQAARLESWYAFREHPSRPIRLYDLREDVGCDHDIAAGEPDVVQEISRIFGEAHADGGWYGNPGETGEDLEARRERARREGTLQTPTRANSRFAAARSLPAASALAGRLPCRAHFFRVASRPAFLLLPPREATVAPVPWVWYAPTLPGHPDPSHEWMFRRWLEQGIAIAGVDVGESYGNPEGRKIYSALHETLVGDHALQARACLLPQSRGGLMLYNWAAENPGKVACVAGIYTVCDLRSWPGLAAASPAYGLREEELAERLGGHNPIDRLEPLARARVPILHLHGDSDTVVPLERNSGELARRYRELGGPVELIVVAGKGHQVCPEFFERPELVDFVARGARREDRARETSP